MVNLKAMMVPGMYRAPLPVVRVWLFLLEKHTDGYSGTPGLLWEDMRESGLMVGRRTLTEALSQLADLGMISYSRHGHHAEIAPVV